MRFFDATKMLKLLETVVESPGSSSTGCFFGHGAESWRETSFLVSWFKYVSHADDIPLRYACLQWTCWHCCHQDWPELPSACFALQKYWLLIPTQHLGSTYSIGQYRAWSPWWKPAKCGTTFAVYLCHMSTCSDNRTHLLELRESRDCGHMVTCSG